MDEARAEKYLFWTSWDFLMPTTDDPLLSQSGGGGEDSQKGQLVGKGGVVGGAHGTSNGDGISYKHRSSRFADSKQTYSRRLKPTLSNWIFT